MVPGTFICCDMKSYYASVECVYRDLDPLKANLLVADEERSDQTIFLFGTPEAVSIPHAFLISTAAGGVLVIKVNERSA